jgi:hypothetical protein
MALCCHFQLICVAGVIGVRMHRHNARVVVKVTTPGTYLGHVYTEYMLMKPTYHQNSFNILAYHFQHAQIVRTCTLSRS